MDCIFKEYEPCGGPLIDRKNVSINMDGTIQLNLGSEKTYKPFLSGGSSSRYILHLKSGKTIECSDDYALCDGTPYGCKRYTKIIVDDLLKQVIDSF